ncbi:MAG: REJ domain-containing protein, partial [Actinomycetes bacterium]
MSGPRLLRGRRRGTSGFTLIEVLLTVGVIGLIMVPVLAWTLVAFQRSNDNSVTSDTRTFTELSRYVDRDLAAAKSVLRWEPAPALPLADPCPVDTVVPTAGQDKVVIDVATQRTWLVILDSRGRNVVYLTDQGTRETDGVRPTRLIRRACVNGVNQPAAIVAERVNEIPAPAGGGTVPVSVECTNRVGYTSESDVCGQLTLKVKGAKGAVVTVSSNRRLRAVRDVTLRPVADIRCAPSCTEFRGADNSVQVELDGSYSSSPVGTPTYAWSFDDPAIPRQTGDRTNPITLTCTNTMSRWNPAIKGCVYRATLTITDPRGQTATRDQNITVLNASPVVAVTPLGVNGFRSEWVCFDASGTVDPDDPTGAGLSFSWDFDDPSSQLNAATGPGIPTANCATEFADSGVVSHQYLALTGTSQRTAVLTVTDGEGVVQTVRIPIRIENKPPVARINSTVENVNLPSGEIIWDGSESLDPDGNAAHDGPSPVATYEWSLIDANGNSAFGNTLVRPTATPWILRLPAPGITSAGIYTVTLTVTDAEGLSASTTKVVNTNTRPRAVISKRTPDKPAITPENNERSYTLDCGPNGSDPGSFDVDEGDFIETYKWEFWTSGTTSSPTEACTAAVAPPCFLNGGTSPTITFGPSQANRVPHGTYRVKLVVTDDNNATNACASQSPYSSTCIDNPLAASPQRWWTDLKINRAPRLTQTTASPTICCTSSPTTPTGLRQPQRRTSIQFGTTTSTDPVNPTRDDDGSIVSYAWTFTKVGGANAPLLGSPTLNIANPVVQFVEPEKDYVVNAKLRVVDNDGAFTEFTQPLYVRNRPPVSTITVNNARTALPPVNNGALTSWATPNPVTQPARFQFKARGSSDPDG